MQTIMVFPLTVSCVFFLFPKIESSRFPLLSDFEPKGEVARKYGVYRREDGVSERALFVIDMDGNIRWNYVSSIGVNPGAHGVS